MATLTTRLERLEAERKAAQVPKITGFRMVEFPPDYVPTPAAPTLFRLVPDDHARAPA